MDMLKTALCPVRPGQGGYAVAQSIKVINKGFQNSQDKSDGGRQLPVASDMQKGMGPAWLRSPLKLDKG